MNTTRSMGRVLGVLAGTLLVCVVALVGLFAVSGFALERWANSKKDQVAADLQTKLGRPVHAGHIHVSVLRGFSIEARDLEIGPDPALPGAPPALKVQSARVRADLFRAVATLGHQLRIKDVLVDGLSLAVVREADGTLDWQHLVERLGPSDQPPSDQARQLRERLRVEHAALRDAKIVLIDQTRSGARAEISHIDLTADGVGVHQPFAAHLTAAVLGVGKNLDAQARFAAADADALPALESATVKLSPVSLAPLAPFTAPLGWPVLSELTDGSMSADLTAELGAAATGGKGASIVKGTVHLAGARIAGGERFDATLDSDVVGDADAGNVDVRRLRLTVGEMELVAQGKLLALREQPRFENFSLTSRGLNFDSLRRYDPGLAKRSGLELGGPFTVSANASGGEGRQSFAVKIDLSAASLEIPGKMRKPAGTTLSLDVAGRAEGQTLRVEEFVLAMAASRLTGSGTLQLAKGAGRSFQAALEAKELALRPLLALVSPSQVSRMPDIHGDARIRIQGRAGQPDTIKVEVPAFDVKSGESAMSGAFTLANLDRPRVTFDGRARFLDLDDFLPEKPPSSSTAKAASASAKKPTPDIVDRAEGRVKLAVDRGRAARVDYAQLKADLTLDHGQLRANTLEVNAFGGRFSGAGSVLPLSAEPAPFVLKGSVAGTDLGAVLARFSPGTPFLRGSLAAQIDLTGRTGKQDLEQTLGGKVSGKVTEAELLAASIGAAVTHALAGAVKIPAVASALAEAETRVPALADRRLGDLMGAVSFLKGTMELDKPLVAHTPYGELSLVGSVHLDGRPDLTGTLQLSPQVLTALAAGKATFTEPLPIKVRITGSMRAPHVAPVELDQPARVLATSLGRALVTEEVKAKATETGREGARKATEAAGRRLRGFLKK